VGLGVAVFAIFASIDYRIFRNSTSMIAGFYTSAIVLLVLVLFFGKTIRGNQAWFEIGSLTFQPVEFAKAALIFALAKFFAQKNIEIWRFQNILFSALYLALPLILVLAQPDWGSGITLVILWFGMVLLAGARPKHVGVIAGVFVLLATLSWFSFFSEGQKARLTALFRPGLDPYGSAYSQRQALVAIGNGRFFGTGLGQGTQSQLKFLPSSRTDFIFAAIAEELGLLGVLLLLASFGILFFRIGRLALEAGNNFSRLFLLGFLILLFSHVFINLGMNLGILPVIGIGLPFVSYGGSSLILLFLLLGVLTSMRTKV